MRTSGLKSDLVNTLCQFNKDHLLHVIAENKDFGEDSNHEISGLQKMTKHEIASHVTSELSEEVCHRLLGTLELNLSWTKSVHLWNVFEMIGKTDENVQFNEVTLKDSLSDQLENGRFENEVNVEHHDGCLWVRLSLKDPLHFASLSTTSFFVYFPGSNFVVIRTLKKNCKEFIMKCLCGVFSCESLQPMSLSGKNVASLCQLAVNKMNNSAPLVQISLPAILHSKKRSLSVESLLDERIHDDDKERKEKRQKYVKTNFGDNVLPQLETLTYETDTVLRSTENLPEGWDNSCNMKCKVVFQGHNVLEGIRQLVKDGIADDNLPSYVSNVAQLGKNVIKIQDHRSNHG